MHATDRRAEEEVQRRTDRLLDEPSPDASDVSRAQTNPLKVLQLVTLILAAASALVLVPFWAPLLLAAWVAGAGRPLHRRLARRLHGSQRAAGVLTVALLLLMLAPLVGLGVTLTGEAIALVKRVLGTDSGMSALQTLVSGSGQDETLSSPSDWDLKQFAQFVQIHGAGAWSTLSAVAGATAKVVIGLFVFVIGSYTFLVNGDRIYAWLLDHTPLARQHTHRFARAFNETGRGLFIGVGLTALLQGAGATVGYAALGLPQWGVLGALTVIGALIPAAGAAVVWAPVSVALFVSDRPSAALVMLVIGVLISSGDNFVRPALSRYGRLELPTFLVLLAMLGGVAVFGTWGLLLGPLLVRLALEAIRMAWGEPKLSLP